MLDGERGSWPAWTDHKIILRDTGRAMSEESTTPDLVELTRQAIQAVSRGDIDSLLSFYAPDALWDASVNGLGVFKGAEAIRGFVVGWQTTYGDYAAEAEEILDLGNGVVLAAFRESGRPPGSKSRVEERRFTVTVWVDGLASAVTFFQDIDEARAAAERLAKERG